MDILTKMQVLATSTDADGLTMRTARRWALQAADEIASLRAGSENRPKRGPAPGEQEHRFAVACESMPGHFGMKHGPFLTVDSALKIDGEYPEDVIVCLSPRDGDRVVYRWGMGSQQWKPEEPTPCA